MEPRLGINEGMPRKNADLLGNAPHKCAVALLLVDVVNDLEFPNNEEIRYKAGAIEICLRLPFSPGTLGGNADVRKLQPILHRALGKCERERTREQPTLSRRTL